MDATVHSPSGPRVRGPATRGLLTLALVTALSGCGGTPSAPPAAGPRQPSREAPATPGVLAEEAPLPEAAPAPAGLVVVGRWRNPSATLAVLGPWVGPRLDPVQLLRRNAPDLAAIVGLDAPVDAVVALPPDVGGLRVPSPEAAISLAVRITPGDLAGMSGARRVAPGVWRIDTEEGKCAVARARGTAPMRLVCTEREPTLERLLPYLVGSLPTEELGPADVTLEARIDAIRAGFGPRLQQARSLAVPLALSELGLDDPRFDRVLGEVLHAVADEALELVEGLDRVRLELSADNSAGAVDARVTLAFRKEGSWLLGAAVDSAARGSGPPTEFLRLPAGSEAASYSLGVGSARWQPLRRPVTELADAALAHWKVPPSARAKTRDLLDALLGLEGAQVTARGSVASRTVPRDDLPAHRWEELRQALGWTVVGVQTPLERGKKLVDRAVALYTDAGLRKQLGTRLGPGVLDSAPKVSSRATRGLPGATTYLITLPRKLAPPPKGAPELSLALVLASHEGYTWAAFTTEEAEAVRLLQEVRRGGGLERRDGIGLVREGRGFAGGFESVAAHARRPGMRTAAALPNAGATPVPYTVEMVGGPSGRSVVATVRLPRAALEDVAALGR